MFVIYDSGDGTWHRGGGEWSNFFGAASRYVTSEYAQEVLEDCDQKENSMNAQNIDHLFRNLRYTKSASEIVEAAKKKATQLRAKVEERQGRIAALRKEYDIDDGDLIQLLTQARKQQKHSAALSYTYSKVANMGNEPRVEEKTIGAGVVNNLLTESDFIEAEKDAVRDLDMIARNLKPIPEYASGNGAQLPDQEFVLNPEELEYLGF